jgi:chromosome segregation ATPase
MNRGQLSGITPEWLEEQIGKITGELRELRPRIKASNTRFRAAEKEYSALVNTEMDLAGLLRGLTDELELRREQGEK